MSAAQLFGILNINKPRGISSRQAVDAVGRLLRKAKLGHAGTLDPMATGVLVVCIGQATRLVPYLQSFRKQYVATFEFGRTSDTDDITGDVRDSDVVRPAARSEIEAALPQFVGSIEQVPPQYSAVHVGGKRAYDLARRGTEVVLEPRIVEVYRISVIEFSWPTITLEIDCGSGTYVRSIGRDLGALLGTGAVMSALARTAVGPFRLADAVELPSLTAGNLLDHLQPAGTAVAHLPRYVCESAELAEIALGRKIRVDSNVYDSAQAQVAVFSESGELACIAEYLADEQSLQPRQVFLRTAD